MRHETSGALVQPRARSWHRPQRRVESEQRPARAGENAVVDHQRVARLAVARVANDVLEVGERPAVGVFEDVLEVPVAV